MTRILRTVLLTAVFVAVPVLPAAAVGDVVDGIADRIDDIADSADCRTPPTPRSPSSGIGNDIDPGPTNPRDGDAFGPNAETTPYEKYGYGGLRYQRYDAGCVLDKIPGDVVNGLGTNLANMGFLVGETVNASAAAARNLARNPAPIIDPMKPVAATTSNLLGEQVYYPLVGIVAVILACYLAWQARTADTRYVGRYLAGAVFMVVVASFMLNYPARALDNYRNLVTTGVNAVDELFTGSTPGVDPATAAAAHLHYNTLARPYMSGLVCTSSGPTYDKYASVLYDTGTLSRSEDVLARSDPGGVGATLVEAKQTGWQAAADEIEQTDPAAYDCLQGERHWEHAAYGFAAATLSGFLGGGDLASSLMVIVALVFGALIVAFFPVIGLLGLAKAEWALNPIWKAIKLVLWAMAVVGVVRLLSNLVSAVMAQVHPVLVSFLLLGLLVGLLWWRRSHKKKKQAERRREREPEPVPQPQPQPEPVPQPVPASDPDPEPVRETQPQPRVAGELTAAPSWTEPPPSSNQPGTGWEWVQPGPPPEQPARAKARVMDPAEEIPKNAVDLGYQRIHRPEGAKNRA